MTPALEAANFATPLPVLEKAGSKQALLVAGGWVTVAAGAFYAAYASAYTGFLIVIYLFALLQLARADTWRRAFYPGLATGLLIAAGQLAFFWRVVGSGAGALWLVYAFWIGLFVALARLCLRRLGGAWGWTLVPFVWLGVEYFRSELYYLRFSWLNAGYAFAAWPWQVPLRHLGMYGMGFVLMSIAAAAAFCWQKSRGGAAAVLTVGLGGVWLTGWLSAVSPAAHPANAIRLAGIQMEFPTENEVLIRLSDLLRSHPDIQLIVLSEYAFDGLVPEQVRAWCREHQLYLIAGGKDPAPGGKFYDTAFVVGPAGEIIFKQGKAVPIQVIKDGLAAPEQRVWESPWGRIGICTCYDLSSTRVTDALVRLGAQALIVPTMDMADWGEAQHVLHARVAPVRAAEYGVPIFRLASSGISQYADAMGRVRASAPFPGDAAVLSAHLELADRGRLPFDRWLAPAAAGLTVALAALFLAMALRRSSKAPDRPTVEVQST